jgi:hypothetical protein
MNQSATTDARSLRTQRYLHHSPSAIDDAIRLLDGTKTSRDFGDMLETTDHGTISR